MVEEWEQSLLHMYITALESRPCIADPGNGTELESKSQRRSITARAKKHNASEL